MEGVGCRQLPGRVSQSGLSCWSAQQSAAAGRLLQLQSNSDDARATKDSPQLLCKHLMVEECTESINTSSTVSDSGTVGTALIFPHQTP